MPDPRGRISRKFEGIRIPRAYVVDRSGRVVHQSVGYGPDGFLKLVTEVERAVRSS